MTRSGSGESATMSVSTENDRWRRSGRAAASGGLLWRRHASDDSSSSVLEPLGASGLLLRGGGGGGAAGGVHGGAEQQEPHHPPGHRRALPQLALPLGRAPGGRKQCLLRGGLREGAELRGAHLEGGPQEARLRRRLQLKLAVPPAEVLHHAPHALPDGEARHRVGNAHVLVVDERGLHRRLALPQPSLHGANEPAGVVLLHPLGLLHHRLACMLDALRDGVELVALLQPAAPPEHVVARAARHGELAHPVDGLRGGLAIYVHRYSIRQQPVPFQATFVVVVKCSHELRGSVLHYCFAEVLGPSVGQNVPPRHVVDVFGTLLTHLLPHPRATGPNLSVSAANTLFEVVHLFICESVEPFLFLL
mmetsp:Transcript_5736/g.11719  ORF Transcript_5736/g.11719 Transcript_5736/m.11719 type:complete len:363 (-) Transcript_5736:732-1820(-)